ncbi:MAG: CoA ester lyase [Alphaproteobacteria bacterium]|nr:CoA ester lyase [Alphaproteobacteria bacterium]
MTVERKRRLRRCQLSVPGSDQRKMAKAIQSAADFVFLDLEDAVAPSAKVAARDQVIAALHAEGWGKKTRAVRINDLRTEWAYEDIIRVVEAAHAVLDVIIIPKVMGPEDVRWVATLLAQIERKLKIPPRIGLEALIEEVEAMIAVEAIAQSSPRLEALIFGMGDYSGSQGVRTRSIGGDVSYPGDIWYYQRSKVVIAARAARIDAIDGPFGNFKDGDGYREECRRAMILGCVGKWAIHPSQIAIAQEVYSPRPEDVAYARRVVDTYAKALAEGAGAVTIDGRMVDAASLRIHQRVLDMAELIGP